MNATKPCLVYAHLGRHFAWDVEGRLICHRETLNELNTRLHELGYKPESPNSAFASGVRDKLRTRHPSLAEQAGR